MLTDPVQLIADLAPGKRLAVIVKGQSYTLPAVIPEQVVVVDPIAVMAKELIDETRTLSAALNQSLEETINRGLAEFAARVDGGFAAVVAGQDKVADGVNRIEGTLHLPVRPMYDSAGKLIGAQRGR